MNFSEDFKNLIESSNSVYIGTGNPESKILIVGKEPANGYKPGRNMEHEEKMDVDFNSNLLKWKINIAPLTDIAIGDVNDWGGIVENCNPLFPFKGMKLSAQKGGHTWRKYQLLHDLILNGRTSDQYDFHNHFFLTELNSSPNPNTWDADKSSIPGRINLLKESKFYQGFPIVILACSNYIVGDQIVDTFHVKFDEVYGQERQKYWVHYNQDINYPPKLVIHARQLSNDVSNELLIGIANVIKKFSERHRIVL